MKSTIHWYVLETDKGYLKRDFRHTHGFTHSLYDAEKFTLNSEYEHGVRVVAYAELINAKIIKVEQEVILTTVD